MCLINSVLEFPCCDKVSLSEVDFIVILVLNQYLLWKYYGKIGAL